MGLQSTDLICNPQNEKSEVVAGPYHEAFGQLVEDSIWYDNIGCGQYPITLIEPLR